MAYPNASLREISSMVRRTNAGEFKQLIEDMKEIMYAYKGVGLAAPQIGVHKRLIVVEHEEVFHELLVLANPKIKILDGETIKSEEGCLSVPGPTAVITRANHIEVTGKFPVCSDGDIIMTDFKQQFFGLPAAIFQHEIDHLEGVLFFDHLKPMAKDMYIRKMKKQIKRGQAWRYQVATSL